MSKDPDATIRRLLASAKPEELREGLELVRQRIATVGSNEARPLLEMVSALFYIDPLDRPDLVPLVNEAISLVVGFGDWVIPELVKNLESGDLKAQMAVAHALGRIGADAIAPLIAEYQASPDPARRMFILYALGKIKSPRIVQAVPSVLEAMESPDRELRDTATRAVGKLAESMPPSQLSEELRERLEKGLHVNLADSNAGIRAKAIRSLGKLGRYGHLTETEREKLRDLCHLALGTDENHEWDRAYIVRKEAAEVLRHT
jgi:HEAT repeat protein